MKRKQLQNFTLGSLIILPLAFLLSEFVHFHILSLTKETIKNLLSTIISASGSFVGFIVIYISISYENFKRNFGVHGTRFFQNNSLILIFLCLLIVTILVSFSAFLLSDTSSFLKNYTLNISCSYFVLSLMVLIPYGYFITKDSSSIEVLDHLIKKIAITDFTEETVKNISALELKAQAEKNNFIVTGDILINNATEKSNRSFSAIVILLFVQLEKLIKDENINKEIKFRITTGFTSLFRELYSIHLNNKNITGATACLAAINSYNKVLVENKLGKKSINQIFDLIISIAHSTIESENEALAEKAIWTYYHISELQLEFNTPKEEDIWQKSEDPDYYVQPIYSNESMEKEALFDLLSENTSYRLNEVVERSFLCKNYHITKDCISMLSSFIKMINWQNSLGTYQKYTIGQSLAYNCVSSIKRFSTINAIGVGSYMNLYLGNITITDILKTNSPLSKSILDELIDLVDFLNAEEKLAQYDVEKIFGLGRLIIAELHLITDYYSHIEKILALLEKVRENKLLTRDPSYKAFMEKGIRSFHSIMTWKNIQAPKLKDLISEHI